MASDTVTFIISRIEIKTTLLAKNSNLFLLKPSDVLWDLCQGDATTFSPIYPLILYFTFPNFPVIMVCLLRKP